MASDIIVYSQEGCPPCSMVKQLLAQQGVRFEVRDIGRDPRAREEFIGRGFRGTPVTVINGDAIVGFDRQRILAALQGGSAQPKPPVRIVW